jgi:glutamine amidotransferase PdxT
MTVVLDIGKLRQTVTLANPRDVTVDGDTTQVYDVALNPPTWRASIEKASVRTAERSFGATVIAQATNILTGRFHPGITTETQMTWVDRAGVTHTGSVLDVADPEGAGVATVVLVAEVVA